MIEGQLVMLDSPALFENKFAFPVQVLSRWFKQYRIHLFICAAISSILIIYHLDGYRGFITQNKGSPSLTHYTVGAHSSEIAPVQNSSLGFERILVINLPTRTDKIDALRLSASLTGINFTLVPGVLDEDVAVAALPYVWPAGEEPGMGAWRAHMNALNMVIRDGLSSALILEDDIDWDVHVKNQLPPIAHGTRQLGIERLKRVNKTSQIPPHSPYGDDWDVLWLGHCASELRHPADRFLIANDPTVPPANHRWNMWQPGFNDVDVTNSTRVVSANNQALCTLSYAVSYAGAQKILYHMGTKPYKDPYDMGLKSLCDARDKHKYDVQLECLHVWPSLMNSYRPAGKSDAGDSDINGPNKNDSRVRQNGYVFNTVTSARMNLGRLLNGEEPLPQWKDLNDWQDVEEGTEVETRYQEKGWWNGDEMTVDLSAHYENPPRFDAIQTD